MPYLDAGVIRGLAALSGDEAVLVPASDIGLEPLHAMYSTSVLPLLEEALASGRIKIIDFLKEIGARVVPAEEVAKISSGPAPFLNINSPEDYQRLSP